MKIKTFDEFVMLKEAAGTGKEKVSPMKLPPEKGFDASQRTNLRPIINAFLNSGSIIPVKGTGSDHATMKKKDLFLVGGAVRDTIMGDTPRDLDLATNASPEEIAMILTAAGFKRNAQKDSGDLEVPQPFYTEQEPEEKKRVETAKSGDKMTWYVRNRDNSKDRKPYVIAANVNGEEFEIAPFRKDSKGGNAPEKAELVDDLSTDSEGRDLTINSMYIHLKNADGPNVDLYDPQNGYAHLLTGTVKSNDPDARFGEDPIRILRAAEAHARYAKNSRLDPSIRKAVSQRTSDMKNLPRSSITQQFLKGLLNKKVDPRIYMEILRSNGLLKVVFPDMTFDANSVPLEWSDKQDRPLALAWILQHNDIKEVEKLLSAKNEKGDDTGWTNQDRKAVVYLLTLLKDWNPKQITKFRKDKSGAGLSERQIQDWVDMFKIKAGPVTRDRKPDWAKGVRAMSGFSPKTSHEGAMKAGHFNCSFCKGRAGSECPECSGSGLVSGAEQGRRLADLEADEFSKFLAA